MEVLVREFGCHGGLDLESARVRLNGVIDDLCVDARKVADEECLPVLYSIVSKYTEADLTSRVRVMDVLCSGLSCLCASIDISTSGSQQQQQQQDDDDTEDEFRKITRDALRLHVHFLSSIVASAEKMTEEAAIKVTAGKKNTKTSSSAKNDGTLWENHREKVVRVLAGTLDLNLNRLWQNDKNGRTQFGAFLGLFPNICATLLESASAMKVANVKACVAHIFSVLSTRFGQSDACVSCADAAVERFEHAALAASDICHGLAAANEVQLVTKIILEVSKKDQSELSRNTTLAKNVGTFIAELADRLPHVMLSTMSLFLPHLDGESYIMRNAVVHLLGQVLVHAVGKEKSETAAKTRESLLDVLSSRCHDVNAFARAKVLQTWTVLCEKRAIPVKRLPHLCLMASERLDDKSSFVRKAACQLLSILLHCNPYGQSLPLPLFETKWEDAKKSLAAITEKMDKALTEEINGAVAAIAAATKEDDDDDEEEEKEEKKEEKTTTAPASALPNEEEIAQIQQRVSFYEAAVKFIQGFHKAITRLMELLHSKTNTDVVEAIECICGAEAFGILAAKEGVREMLLLIWSREAAVKEGVIDAYRRLFFPQQAMESKMQLVVICRRLLSLLASSSVGAVESLEVLFVELAEQKIVSGLLCTVLADIATRKLPGQEVSPVESEQAYQLLSLLAAALPDATSQNLPRLVDYAIETYNSSSSSSSPHHGLLLVRHLAHLIPALNRKQKIATKSALSIAERLTSVVLAPRGGGDLWFSMAERVVNALFAVVPHPHVQATHIIRSLAAAAFSTNPPPSELVARVLFVVGYVAVKMLVKVESLVKLMTNINNKKIEEAERQEEQAVPVKKAASAASKAKKTTTKKPKASKKSKGSDDDDEDDDEVDDESDDAYDDSESEKPKKKTVRKPSAAASKAKLEESIVSAKKKKDEEEDIAAQLGVDAAATMPEEIELMLKRAENEITSIDGLLGSFAPIAAAICSRPAEHTTLRSVAALTLCRLMCISSALCEQHIQLLFSVLTAESTPANLRCNIVVSVGDISFRFPLCTEPYMPHMYMCLRDADAGVRKNAMLVLTHLILNDMIKIKGQISEMAVCLEDKNASVAQLARVFFSEFSHKGGGSVLYNVLPDLLSRLSADNLVNEAAYRRIMSHLFSFVTKEKQTESLGDRLGGRLRESTCDRSARDVAFCMQLLTWSEKSVKRLIEGFAGFAARMTDDDVAASFQNIVSRSRKLIKGTEGKTVFDELETKIAVARGAASENGEEEGGAEGGAGEKAKTDTTVVAAKGRGRKAAATAVGAAASKAKAAAAARKKKQVVSESSGESEVDVFSSEEDSEDEEDEKENAKPKANSRAAASSAAAKKAAPVASTSGRAVRATRAK